MESKLEKYTPLIKTALDKAKENDVYAVLRLQDNKSVVVEIVDGMTENKTSTTSKGIGISTFAADGTIGFASTSRLDEEAVKKAVDMASSLAKNSSKYDLVKRNKEIFDTPSMKGTFLQKIDYNMSSKTSDEIESIVQQLNKETKSLDHRLSVRTIYSCVEDERRVARSDGTDVTFNVPISRVLSYLILKEDKKVSQAIFKVQGTDYGVILKDELKHVYAKRAKSTAKLVSDLLNAGTMKGGHYKSLLSHSFIGLYAHEAVGHAFETDGFKSSVIASNGKLRRGEKVAPENINFIDGPVDGMFGNQFISANGTQRKTVEFIKNGIITDALSDVFTAKEAGVEANGCERAQSYSSQPIPRMSVTRMVDNSPIPFDKKCLEDITLDEIYDLLVKHGELSPGESVVYPVIGMGGMVNPAEGNFVFNCAGIYLIENPKNITLYRQSIFSGNTLKTIATRAKGIGPVILDDSGTCGKSHQGAPVSDGGNLLFVLDKSDHITFGGE
jgi:TldD protein